MRSISDAQIRRVRGTLNRTYGSPNFEGTFGRFEEYGHSDIVKRLCLLA